MSLIIFKVYFFVVRKRTGYILMHRIVLWKCPEVSWADIFSLSPILNCRVNLVMEEVRNRVRKWEGVSSWIIIASYIISKLSNSGVVTANMFLSDLSSVFVFYFYTRTLQLRTYLCRKTFKRTEDTGAETKYWPYEDGYSEYGYWCVSICKHNSEAKEIKL